jgi:hypothetical protein
VTLLTGLPDDESVRSLDQACQYLKVAQGGLVKSRIMYLESKVDGVTGPARIGRVTYSKSGRSLYYDGRTFQSLKGRGFKANYVDVETGAAYWISGPRRDGADRLYGEAMPVEIDADVRAEYWEAIRRLPERRSEPVANR